MNTRKQLMAFLFLGVTIGISITSIFAKIMISRAEKASELLKVERNDAWLQFIYNTYQTGLHLKSHKLDEIQSFANATSRGASSQIIRRMRNSPTYPWWLVACSDYARLCNIEIDPAVATERERLSREHVFGSGSAFESLEIVGWHDEIGEAAEFEKLMPKHM